MKFCLSFLFVFVGFLATGQNSAQFYTSVDRGTIQRGEIFSVKYTIENAEVKHFSPPDFKPFLKVSGPSRSQSTTIINGKQSTSLTLSYQLQSGKTGEFVIDPAEAMINGLKKSTSPLKIKIVEPDNIELDLEEDNVAIARRIMNADTAYVGQQVLMDYTIMTKQEVRGAEIFGESDYDQFYVQEPRLFDRYSKSQLINGEPFKLKTLTRRCLFPQFPGEYEFLPVTVQANVLSDRSQRRGFFFMDRTTRVQTATSSDTLVVLSLPVHSPRGFTGGVGNYRYEAYWNRTSASVDGALSLIIKLQGDGDPKRIVPPELVLSDTFQLSEPQLVHDVVSEQQGRIVSAHTFEYLVTPKVEGQFQIDLELAHFNPDEGRYIVKTLALPEIQVGPETRSSEDQESVLFGQEERSKEDSSTFLWVAGGAIAAAALAYLAFLAVGQRSKDSEPEAIDYTKRAQSHLTEASQALSDHNADQFYQALRSGIYGYAARVLGVPISEATRSKVVDRFREKHPDDSIVDRLDQIIVQSEHALYAGGADVNRMQEYYNDAVEILAHLEKQAS